MIWVAPSEKDAANEALEKRLWAAADQLRANSGLTSAQYSQPVLGLIFLRFAEVRFATQRMKLEKAFARTRWMTDFHAPIPRRSISARLPQCLNTSSRVIKEKAEVYIRRWPNPAAELPPRGPA
jgi:type I restriction-modification system DNA methylase subunit